MTAANLTKIRTCLLAPLMGGLLLASSLAQAGPNDRGQQPRASQQVPASARYVDIVLALDTSSSMDGLIDAARQKLWDVVTLMSKAQPRPILRVGLISYGNTGYDASKGWVRKDVDLTTDLDTVYGKLFALHTSGGDEYVARAVDTATQQMAWNQQHDTLRIVFVAGNESAEQDPAVSLKTALDGARAHNIFVNAIYCGSERAGDATSWARVAAMGKGKFAAVDQHRTVAIAAPQDEELRKLSEELNQTYVAYGADGESRSANQAAQDRNAATSAPMAASRAAAKSSAMYRADDWDLVDATKAGKRDVKTMAPAELPAPMRALSPQAREQYVAEKAKKRETLQKRIQGLNTEREHFVQEKRRATAASGPAVDDALLGGIKSEAEASGYKF